jgi:PAS domain S-box-containing protein
VDNTESKLAEEALRVSEEKFSRLFLSSPDAVSLSELESGRLMEVNDGFQTVFGYGREEAIGRTTLELGLYVNPVDRAQMVQEVRDRGSIRNLELSGRHRSGSDLTVSLSVELIRIGGEPFLITTARDVTERKQAEEELRNSRALMKSMLDSIPDLLVVIDRQFRIMYSNFKGHDQLQLPEGTACSTCYQRFKLLDAPCEDCSAHSVFETGRPVEREMINPADGRVREVRGFPVLDASGQVMMVIEHVRDITERKRAEEELRASLEEKESLLKEVHHRVKNNLQIISSLLKLQARKVQSPEVHGFLRDTQNRIRSMALLHETLYRSGNLARVELLQYAKNVCTHVASSYASGGGKIRLLHKIADLTLDLDRAIPAGLIISELVSNAFKHAYPSGSTGEILVELQSTAEHQLVLRVSDDGIGLSVGADPQNAQSLGLLLVRSLTRQLDGRMSVSSGQGTVFEIVFPAQPL